ALILWARRHGPRVGREFTPFMQYGGYSLIAVFFGSVLVLALLAPHNSLFSRTLPSPPPPFFRQYSYPLYVFHYLLKGPADVLFAPFVRRTAGTALGSVVLLAYPVATLAATVALSLLSWRVVETPFLRLKRHFEY